MIWNKQGGHYLKTLNITAYDNKKSVGCLRILSNGYYFGTITELLVLPQYQKQGTRRKLLQLAKDDTPTMLCYISVLNKQQRNFMKRTVVERAYNLT